MRPKPLLAALLAMLPVPALADVTARYTAGGNTLTIEADDGGNVRADIGDKATLIRRDGVDYVVVKDSTGDLRVARVDDLLAIVRAQMGNPDAPKPPAAMSTEFTLTRVGDETVAGRAGERWRFGPASKPLATGEREPAAPRDQMDFVVSADPVLAPVGGFFRHMIDLAGPIALTAVRDGNFMQLFNELLTKGTPIRVGPALTLESVDTGEIAAVRFELPGPVLPAAEFMAALEPSSAARAMPPLP